LAFEGSCPSLDLRADKHILATVFLIQLMPFKGLFARSIAAKLELVPNVEPFAFSKVKTWCEHFTDYAHGSS
jgi:hypothetical protein